MKERESERLRRQIQIQKEREFNYLEKKKYIVEQKVKEKKGDGKNESEKSEIENDRQIDRKIESERKREREKVEQPILQFVFLDDLLYKYPFRSSSSDNEINLSKYSIMGTCTYRVFMLLCFRIFFPSPALGPANGQPMRLCTLALR